MSIDKLTQAIELLTIKLEGKVKMNIDKEVEKYNKKKDQLLVGLISRLVGYANDKRRAVANIDRAVSDLADQKIVHLNEIDIVNDHLKLLK